MKRRLSTKILVQNLVIVTGSLVFLATAMLFIARYFILQETTREFEKARSTMEMIIQQREKNSPEAILTQEIADRTVRQTSVLFADLRALLLTSDMKYPDGAQNRPLGESVLRQVGTDGSIVTIRSGGSSYLAATLSFMTPGGESNLMIYTSLDGMNAIVGRLALIMLLALAAAALVAALASVFMARRIALPLGRLSRWAHSIGGREFTRYGGQSGTAEIDFLAESLNGMAQRLQDYDSAQKTFLQNASHELRTPLMSIQGYAEGIKHGVFADAGSAADVVISESLRLAALVDDLLFLTRLETADGFYAFAPVPLGEVLSQCAEKLEGAAIKEGKKLTLLHCPKATVRADGEKLLRALMNLAGNCLRYAKTEVTMVVSVPNDTALITVRDDGPGFDPEDMGNLFTRFYKGKQGKFGLGLSIAKAIVEKHGGTISAANGENGGAEFIVELPLLRK
jgi:signal transduction histidine kinase